MNHAKKLLEHLKSGLFSHILISGTPEAFDNLYVNLVKECRANNLSTFTIEFSNDDPSYFYQYKVSDVLFVKGLEILPPKHHQAYSLRTMLDAGKHKGLKSFIFCEQTAVKQHFDDYTAPFYRFCLRYSLSLLS